MIITVNQALCFPLEGDALNVVGDATTIPHNGSPFSTADRDNDYWEEGNCAEVLFIYLCIIYYLFIYYLFIYLLITHLSIIY